MFICLIWFISFCAASPQLLKKRTRIITTFAKNVFSNDHTFISSHEKDDIDALVVTFYFNCLLRRKLCADAGLYHNQKIKVTDRFFCQYFWYKQNYRFQLKRNHTYSMKRIEKDVSLSCLFTINYHLFPKTHYRSIRNNKI